MKNVTRKDAKMKSKKIIIYCLLLISLLFALALTFLLDKNLYLCPEEYVETNEKSIIMDDVEDKIELKYNWQIAIPKLDVIAPIGEGSDIVTLRNRVGHIAGTGQLSRQYLFSSDTIIQITILQVIIILTELMN